MAVWNNCFEDMKIYTPEENKIDSCATFSYLLNLPQYVTVSTFPLQQLCVFKLVVVSTVLSKFYSPISKLEEKRWSEMFSLYRISLW